MKKFIDDRFEMPDRMVALIISFLEQITGRLFNRARKNEFKDLPKNEVIEIEKKYQEILIVGKNW